MRFSIYSEMQLWPGKSPERLYAEVEEQIVHADRLGYDAYAIVEHFFFPRFSISPDPLALFAQVAPRTQRIRFRTMLHCLPFHNPTVLASRIAAAAILTGGRYEFGVGRGHGWGPPKAGVRIEDVRELYDESFEIFFKALENERFSPQRPLLRGPRLAPRAAAAARRRGLRRRHERLDLRARRAPRLGGRGAAAAPLRGAARPARHLPRDLRRARPRARHRLDPRLLHGRGPRRRAARRRAGDAALPRGQRVAARRARRRPRSSQAAGYGFYTSGIMEALAATPYDEMIDGDIVWVGTPEDVAERVAGDHRRLRGPHRDRDHRQPRRLRALAGDQDAGDLRRRGRTPLPRGDSGGSRARRTTSRRPRRFIQQSEEEERA